MRHLSNIKLHNARNTERKGFLFLGPIRELLIIIMVSGSVLTVLLNAVSVFKSNSNNKEQTALSPAVFTVRSLDFDLDRQVYLVHSWPNDLCEIHTETGALTVLPTPPAPLQISIIAASQRSSTRITVADSTDSGLFLKQVHIARGGELIHSEDLAEEICSVANVGISSDGMIAALTSEDGYVVGFDLGSGTPRRWQFKADDPIFADRLSPDGQSIFLADGYQKSFIYDLRSGTKAVEISLNRGCNRTVVWSNDSNRLATSDVVGGIHVFDASDGRMIWSLKTGFLFARSLALSADGRILAAGGLGKEIRLWDLSMETDEPKLIIRSAGVAHKLLFTDSEKTIVAGNEDGSICEWSAVTGQLVRKFRSFDSFSSTELLSRN